MNKDENDKYFDDLIKGILEPSKEEADMIYPTNPHDYEEEKVRDDSAPVCAHQKIQLEKPTIKKERYFYCSYIDGIEVGHMLLTTNNPVNYFILHQKTKTLMNFWEVSAEVMGAYVREEQI